MDEDKLQKYRVFCSENQIKNLPSEVRIEKQYPAFTILSASEEVIEQVRKLYLVEKLPLPQPPPDIPVIANLKTILALPQKQGPYYFVVRPNIQGEQYQDKPFQEAGCEVCGVLGSSTVVVKCPNKVSLTKLRKLPDVDRLSQYIPRIRISPRFFEGFGNEVAKQASAEMPEAADATSEISSSSGTFFPATLVAGFFTEDDQQRAKRHFRRQRIRDITEASPNNLIISLLSTDDPLKAVQTIASWPGLRFLEEQPLMKLSNDVARLVVADRVISPSPVGLGLTGKGELVAVADTGLDTGDPSSVHLDFRGRVKIRNCESKKSNLPNLVDQKCINQLDGPEDRYSGHGTHVAGSIIGNGARSIALGLPPIQGVAPEAQLYFQAIERIEIFNRAYLDSYLRTYGQLFYPNGNYGIPDNLQDLFKDAYAQNARIHSNSWGGGDPGFYDVHCEQLDEFVWNYKDFLILFSAGNHGNDGVLSPGTAKNCLTVGASENNRVGQFPASYGSVFDFPDPPFLNDNMADSIDDIAAFSGRGPTTTGRRKPDVVAPGTYILSTRSTQVVDPCGSGWGLYPKAQKDYMFMGGTSMATPLVAGCAVLVRQYLRGLGIKNPSAALLKAIIIHSAKYFVYRFANPSSSRWADNEQGWGRVDLQQVLNPQGSIKVLFFDETTGLKHGTDKNIEIELKDSSVPLRITMVYTDYPGVDLIQNLNLTVKNPSGGEFFGNDFNNLGNPDNNNNVEGIIVENPIQGKWSIRVIAKMALHGPQDFALVVSGGNIILV